MGTVNVTEERIELTAVDKASAAIGQVKAGFEGLKSSADALKAALGVLGVAVSAGAFVSMTKGIVEMEAGLLRLAQRSGSTVEAIGGLGRVASKSGTDLDTVAAGLQKLSKSMTEAGDGTSKASKVFDALGISTTNASGAMRPAQEVMQELAKRLATMQDKTLAVAFAQELLGKSGANLLPFMYELAEAGALNSKVTTEQAKRAKELEDNLNALKKAGDAWKLELVNAWTPSLAAFTKQLLDAQKAAGNLAAALLQVTLTDTSNPRKRIGEIDASLREMDTVGGLPSWAPGSGMVNGALEVKRSFLNRQRQFLIYTEQSNAAAMGADPANWDRNDRLLNRPFTPKNPFGGKEGGAARDDYTPTARSLDDRIAVMNAEIAANRKLTDAEKESIKIRAEIAGGYKVMTAAQLADIEAKLKRTDALQKELEHQERVRKSLEELRKEQQNYIAEQLKGLDGQIEQNKQLERHVQEIGLTTAQLAALKVARAEEALAVANQRAETLALAGAGENELYVAQERIKAAQKYVDLVKQEGNKNIATEQAKAAATEWQRTADHIQRGLTDALMRGFESGKSFARNALDVIINMFKTAVLEPMIRPIAAGVGGSIASMLMPGVANAGMKGGMGMPGFNPFSSFGQAGADFGNFFGNIGQVNEMGEVFGIGDAIGGFAAANPFVTGGVLLGGALLGGLLGGGGGPKASDIGLVDNGAGGLRFTQNNVTDSGWGEAFGSQFDARYAALSPEGKAMLHAQSWQAGGPASAQGMVSQFIEPLLRQAEQATQAAAQAAEAATKAAADQLAAAQKQLDAARAQQASATANLQKAVGGLPGQLGIDALQQFQDSLATSDTLAPTNRLAGAKGIFSRTLAAAMSGDLDAVKAFPGVAQNYIGIARDTYASGSDFQSVFLEANRALNDLLAHQQALQTDILKDVPATIQQAAKDQIGALREGFASMVDEITALRRDISRLELQAA